MTLTTSQWRRRFDPNTGECHIFIEKFAAGSFWTFTQLGKSRDEIAKALAFVQKMNAKRKQAAPP